MAETTSDRAARHSAPSKILRFRRSERLIHWAFAVPFLLCYGTAAILMFGFYSDPNSSARHVFSWIHRVGGICFWVLPPLAVIRKRGDIRVHLNNIKQAWVWTFADIKWLGLMGLAAVNKRVVLPEQGKFNSAEKLNFMLLMTTYPLYLLTGALIWFTHAAFIAWVAHLLMAAVATPFILGHMFMATLNPGTRAGLSGMVSGYVDRQWAKHHYRKWYDEHPGTARQAGKLEGAKPALCLPALSENMSNAAGTLEPSRSVGPVPAPSGTRDPKSVAPVSPGSGQFMAIVDKEEAPKTS